MQGQDPWENEYIYAAIYRTGIKTKCTEPGVMHYQKWFERAMSP